MKKFLLTLVAATFMASNASAALIDLSNVVFSSGGQTVTGFQNGSQSVTFSFLTFNVTSCVGAQAGLCGPTATLSISPLNSADPGRTITFSGPGGPLVLTLNTGWTVNNNLLTTSGTFTAPSFDATPGVIQFAFADVEGDLIGSFTANATTNSPVPEPTSLFLMGSGLLGLGLVARRRRK